MMCSVYQTSTFRHIYIHGDDLFALFQFIVVFFFVFVFLLMLSLTLFLALHAFLVCASKRG